MSSESNGSAGKIDRMVRDTRALGGAIAEWIELRIALVRSEVEEEVNHRLNTAVRRLLVGLIFAVAALFVLVTVALGLGLWLGHPVWGFGIVAAVLIVIAAIVGIAMPEQRLVSLEPPLEPPTDPPLDSSPDPAAARKSPDPAAAHDTESDSTSSSHDT